MTDNTEPNRTLPLAERLLYAVPLLGWMLKDVVYGKRDNIWYFLTAIVSLWIIAIMNYGIPAVVIPVVALVPAVFALLLTITRG